MTSTCTGALASMSWKASASLARFTIFAGISPATIRQKMQSVMCPRSRPWPRRPRRQARRSRIAECGRRDDTGRYPAETASFPPPRQTTFRTDEHASPGLRPAAGTGSSGRRCASHRLPVSGSLAERHSRHRVLHLRSPGCARIASWPRARVAGASRCGWPSEPGGDPSVCAALQGNDSGHSQLRPPFPPARQTGPGRPPPPPAQHRRRRTHLAALDLAPPFADRSAPAFPSHHPRAIQNRAPSRPPSRAAPRDDALSPSSLPAGRPAASRPAAPAPIIAGACGHPPPPGVHHFIFRREPDVATPAGRSRAFGLLHPGKDRDARRTERRWIAGSSAVFTERRMLERISSTGPTSGASISRVAVEKLDPVTRRHCDGRCAPATSLASGSISMPMAREPRRAWPRRSRGFRCHCRGRAPGRRAEMHRSSSVRAARVEPCSPLPNAVSGIEHDGERFRLGGLGNPGGHDGEPAELPGPSPSRQRVDQSTSRAGGASLDRRADPRVQLARSAPRRRSHRAQT